MTSGCQQKVCEFPFEYQRTGAGSCPCLCSGSVCVHKWLHCEGNPAEVLHEPHSCPSSAKQDTGAHHLKQAHVMQYIVKKCMITHISKVRRISRQSCPHISTYSTTPSEFLLGFSFLVKIIKKLTACYRVCAGVQQGRTVNQTALAWSGDGWSHSVTNTRTPHIHVDAFHMHVVNADETLSLGAPDLIHSD